VGTHSAAQDAIGVAVVTQIAGTGFLKAHQVIQIDRRQIELEIRAVGVEYLQRQLGESKDGEKPSELPILAFETFRIDMPAGSSIVVPAGQ